MNLSNIKSFVKEYSRVYTAGGATEYSYRTAFEILFKSYEGIIPINDPKQSVNGKPDFIFNLEKNPDIVVGYAEMKEPGKNLDDVETTDQWLRYKNYSNIFLTDGLEWRFYKNGVEFSRTVIASIDLHSRKLKLLSDKYEELLNLLVFFFENSNEVITSGKRLAGIMGNKARLIRDYILKISKDEQIDNEEIDSVFQMFKELLVADLTVAQFADMYSQTLVYGLFVARYNDPTIEDFSRSEARDLIPSTNPLLREFFDHIAGANFNTALQPIVDSLCQIFCLSDIKHAVDSHMNNDDDDEKDSIIHFYEDFLASYDPELRKQMGAYYTPTPVVKYIIHAVDESLKNDFDIEDGIASDEQIEYKHDVLEGFKKGKGTGKNTYFEEKLRIPKVQILDPAVGTATFLNEIIKYIYDKHFSNQQGIWTDYVNNNLLARLNGFEFMMTPYTIAHLKVGMTLRDLGTEEINKRLRIYLTNTLSEGIKSDVPMYYLAGLVKAVTKESELASEVKNDLPVMAILGNPPYSKHSKNKSDFITKLLIPYKQDLNERAVNLDDDYIKFIRFSENMIEKNSRGIIAMITNNSYLAGDSHKTMRKHLLQSFDKITILNLHGKSFDGSKEKTPDGSIDENVFDIRQGVSIVVMVKNNTKRRALGRVYYADIFGSRKHKFDCLKNSDVEYKELDYSEPDYLFMPRKYSLSGLVSVNDLFNLTSSGISTGDSDNQICYTKEDIRTVVNDFISLSESEYREKYNLKDNDDHNYMGMKADINGVFDEQRIVKTLWHSIFDIRYTYYTEKSAGFLARPRAEVMKHLAYHSDNFALIYKRGHIDHDGSAAAITRYISNRRAFSRSGMTGGDYIAPLYYYSDDGEKHPNFNEEKLSLLLAQIGEQSPEDVFDYIYAVLNSPSYLDEFSELLESTYPAIPVPDLESFERLVPLGRRLRRIHLMDVKLDSPVGFPISGDNVVSKLKFDSSNNRIYINKQQYFDNIPEDIWNFKIGANQPAQNWLKDRKDRELTYKDISFYEQIIAILINTDSIMQEIG